MTLIIGIICEDGDVMAADSASTDMTAQVKQPTSDKLRRIGTKNMVLGGSGNVGLLQTIREVVDGYTGTASTIKNVRRDLKALMLPQQRQAIADHIPLQMAGMNQPPVACLLAAGYAGAMPFLIEFEANGEDTSYDASMGNFCAIGSGKTYAHALFRTHLTRKRDLKLGKILAFRVVSDSIDLAHYGLAHPVHMWTITQAAVALVSDEEKAELGETVKIWRELESEALGKLLAPASGPPLEVPTPEEAAAEAGDET
jgi:20S proteasome alpha/beta subunit